MGWALACSPQAGSAGLTQVVNSQGPARNHRAPMTVTRWGQCHGHQLLLELVKGGHTRAEGVPQQTDLLPCLQLCSRDRRLPWGLFLPQGLVRSSSSRHRVGSWKLRPSLDWHGQAQGPASPRPWLPTGSLCPQHRCRPTSQRCLPVSTSQESSASPRSTEEASANQASVSTGPPECPWQSGTVTRATHLA